MQTTVVASENISVSGQKPVPLAASVLEMNSHMMRLHDPEFIKLAEDSAQHSAGPYERTEELSQYHADLPVGAASHLFGYSLLKPVHAFVPWQSRYANDLSFVGVAEPVSVSAPHDATSLSSRPADRSVSTATDAASCDGSMPMQRDLTSHTTYPHDVTGHPLATTAMQKAHLPPEVSNNLWKRSEGRGPVETWKSSVTEPFSRSESPRKFAVAANSAQYSSRRRGSLVPEEHDRTFSQDSTQFEGRGARQGSELDSLQRLAKETASLEEPVSRSCSLLPNRIASRLFGQPVPEQPSSPSIPKLEHVHPGSCMSLKSVTCTQSENFRNIAVEGDLAISEGTGWYLLEKDVMVRSTSAFSSWEVGRISKGTLIRVVEILLASDGNRVRGRIVVPPGWITLADASDGCRWAAKVHGATECGCSLVDCVGNTTGPCLREGGFIHQEVFPCDQCDGDSERTTMPPPPCRIAKKTSKFPHDLPETVQIASPTIPDADCQRRVGRATLRGAYPVSKAFSPWNSSKQKLHPKHEHTDGPPRGTTALFCAGFDQKPVAEHHVEPGLMSNPSVVPTMFRNVSSLALTTSLSLTSAPVDPGPTHESIVLKGPHKPSSQISAGGQGFNESIVPTAPPKTRVKSASSLVPATSRQDTDCNRCKDLREHHPLVTLKPEKKLSAESQAQSQHKVLHGARLSSFSERRLPKNDPGSSLNPSCSFGQGLQNEFAIHSTSKGGLRLAQTCASAPVFLPSNQNVSVFLSGERRRGPNSSHGSSSTSRQLQIARAYAATRVSKEIAKPSEVALTDDSFTNDVLSPQSRNASLRSPQLLPDCGLGNFCNPWSKQGSLGTESLPQKWLPRIQAAGLLSSPQNNCCGPHGFCNDQGDLQPNSRAESFSAASTARGIRATTSHHIFSEVPDVGSPLPVLKSTPQLVREQTTGVAMSLDFTNVPVASVSFDGGRDHGLLDLPPLLRKSSRLRAATTLQDSCRVEVCAESQPPGPMSGSSRQAGSQTLDGSQTDLPAALEATSDVSKPRTIPKAPFGLDQWPAGSVDCSTSFCNFSICPRLGLLETAAVYPKVAILPNSPPAFQHMHDAPSHENLRGNQFGLDRSPTNAAIIEADSPSNRINASPGEEENCADCTANFLSCCDDDKGEGVDAHPNGQENRADNSPTFEQGTLPINTAASFQTYSGNDAGDVSHSSENILDDQGCKPRKEVVATNGLDDLDPTSQSLDSKLHLAALDLSSDLRNATGGVQDPAGKSIKRSYVSDISEEVGESLTFRARTPQSISQSFVSSCDEFVCTAFGSRAAASGDRKSRDGSPGVASTHDFGNDFAGSGLTVSEQFQDGPEINRSPIYKQNPFFTGTSQYPFHVLLTPAQPAMSSQPSLYSKRAEESSPLHEAGSPPSVESERERHALSPTDLRARMQLEVQQASICATWTSDAAAVTGYSVMSNSPMPTTADRALLPEFAPASSPTNPGAASFECQRYICGQPNAETPLNSKPMPLSSPLHGSECENPHQLLQDAASIIPLESSDQCVHARSRRPNLDLHAAPVIESSPLAASNVVTHRSHASGIVDRFRGSGQRNQPLFLESFHPGNSSVRQSVSVSPHHPLNLTDLPMTPRLGQLLPCDSPTSSLQDLACRLLSPASDQILSMSGGRREHALTLPIKARKCVHSPGATTPVPKMESWVSKPRSPSTPVLVPSAGFQTDSPKSKSTSDISILPSALCTRRSSSKTRQPSHTSSPVGNLSRSCEQDVLPPSSIPPATPRRLSSSSSVPGLATRVSAVFSTSTTQTSPLTDSKSLNAGELPKTLLRASEPAPPSFEKVGLLPFPFSLTSSRVPVPTSSSHSPVQRASATGKQEARRPRMFDQWQNDAWQKLDFWSGDPSADVDDSPPIVKRSRVAAKQLEPCRNHSLFVSSDVQLASALRAGSRAAAVLGRASGAASTAAANDARCKAVARSRHFETQVAIVK